MIICDTLSNGHSHTHLLFFGLDLEIDACKIDKAEVSRFVFLCAVERSSTSCVHA